MDISRHGTRVSAVWCSELRRMIFGRRSERFVQGRVIPGQLEIDFGDHAGEAGMAHATASRKTGASQPEVTGPVPRPSSAGGIKECHRGQRRRLDPTLPAREEFVNPDHVSEDVVEISRGVTELLE